MIQTHLKTLIELSTNDLTREILKKLKVVKKSPFEKEPNPNRATRFRRASSEIVCWVNPEVKCLVRYQEIT